MSFWRRKNKESDNGSYRTTGTNLGYPASGDSAGLLPSGSISSAGVSTSDLAKSIAGVGASIGMTIAPGESYNNFLYRLRTQFAFPSVYSLSLYGPSISGSTPGHAVLAPAPLKTETREDPVRAWKRVKLNRCSAWTMVSRMSGETFGGGMSEAVCRAFFGPGSEIHAPGSPVEYCSCGFYGYKKPEFEDYGPSPDASIMQPWLEVDFYGKVIECEKGYRAQYQQPIALHVEESFFEFVGGKQVDVLRQTVVEYPRISSGSLLSPSPYTIEFSSTPLDPKSQCLNPQTLAQQIGVPVVVNGVEYK